MKYGVAVTIKQIGYIEVEADSEAEAKAKAEEAMSEDRVWYHETEVKECKIEGYDRVSNFLSSYTCDFVKNIVVISFNVADLDIWKTAPRIGAVCGTYNHFSYLRCDMFLIGNTIHSFFENLFYQLLLFSVF